MTRLTDEDHARETGPVWRFLKGMVRRLAVTIADSSTSWQVRGVRSPSSGEEVFSVEVFPGVGIFARPPADSAPEAVALGVGGSKSTVIVATRDEATRRLIAAQVEPGDTAIYNATLIVILKASGTIELRGHNGNALQLATKADVDALKTYIRNQFSTASGHTHAVSGAVTTTIATVAAPGTAPTVSPPNAVGTAIVVAE